MDINEYYRLAKVEDSHWWYRAVHKLVIEEINKGWLNKPVILDAGCGTGGLTEKLAGAGFTVGIDISDLALGLKPHSKAVYINGSINNLPFADDSFDLIICISVFYHRRVIDEVASIEIFKALKMAAGQYSLCRHFNGRLGTMMNLSIQSKDIVCLKPKHCGKEQALKYLRPVIFSEYCFRNLYSRDFWTKLE